ncbi:CbrC family protein [uncultured Paludibaculum sp.]|uniref:CbrC family protein n=1 Tax=uncultured Paludibaculum sp. TaxID=1765020 RepID=UPI002AAAE385|nr:CbrC family protein [uncultured Paludibaculum sp.]
MDTTTSLPAFKYHPDPVSTGAVVRDEDAPCLSCNRIRGYVYDGPVYSEKFHHLTHCLCPWCIADGSAARRFGAEFADSGTMDGVTNEVREEIAKRTPGFLSWQEGQWLTCCSDAAEFLGAAGAKELAKQLPEARRAVEQHLRDDFDLSGKELKEFMAALSKEDQPTAYVFRCRHCREYLAYVDQT